MKKIFTIPAKVTTDDNIASAEFDAIEWFLKASDSTLIELHEIEYGGDYEADEVAEFFESRNAEVKSVFDYKNIVGKFKTMGFECYVDSEAAIKWILEFRPHLADKIS